MIMSFCQMAFKRKSAPKRRFKRRRPVRRSFVSRVKNIVRAQVLEKKVLDGQASQTVPNTGVLQHLTLIAQGDSIDTRDGWKVALRGLSLGGIVYNHADAAEGTIYHLYIVRDLQQIADTSPTIGNIFDLDDGVNPQIKPETRGRFKILLHKRLIFNQNITSQVLLKPINFWLRLKNNIVSYNGSTVNDIQRNGLYIVQVSNQATNTPTPSFITKLYYTDT